jgi:hypothetical protein
VLAICALLVVEIAVGTSGIPVKVGDASGAFTLSCVCAELVRSTKAKAAGNAPSTVLLVRVCVSVVPTIAPVGAAIEVPHALEPL